MKKLIQFVDYPILLPNKTGDGSELVLTPLEAPLLPPFDSLKFDAAAAANGFRLRECEGEIWEFEANEEELELTFKLIGLEEFNKALYVNFGKIEEFWGFDEPEKFEEFVELFEEENFEGFELELEFKEDFNWNELAEEFPIINRPVRPLGEAAP